MQELSSHVYIETQYAGVTLGAISWTHGLVLVDAPFRPEDVRSWRSALLNLGGGVDRLLISLDAHIDRTLGVRSMDCILLTHEKVAAIFRNRPMTSKTQGADTGSDSELYNGIGGVRWAPPDLTFSQKMEIHWGDQPLLIEHHPGPAAGASWVELPEDRLAFIGDAVVVNQPPFLASAEIPAWISTLKLLLTPEYRNYTLVSSRGGLLITENIHQQIRVLESIHHALEQMAAQKANPEDTAALVPQLMRGYTPAPGLEMHYHNRLQWGLHQLYARYYRQMAIEEE